jgi:hypothetical protein
MAHGNRDIPVTVRFIVWGVAGTCILCGIFGILMHDLLKSIGIPDVSTYGWIALCVGIGLYVIEGLLFMHGERDIPRKKKSLFIEPYMQAQIRGEVIVINAELM